MKIGGKWGFALPCEFMVTIAQLPVYPDLAFIMSICFSQTDPRPSWKQTSARHLLFRALHQSLIWRLLLYCAIPILYSSALFSLTQWCADLCNSHRSMHPVLLTQDALGLAMLCPTSRLPSHREQQGQPVHLPYGVLLPAWDPTRVAAPSWPRSSQGWRP
jgi:hypothetical protein